MSASQENMPLETRAVTTWSVSYRCDPDPGDLSDLPAFWGWTSSYLLFPAHEWWWFSFSDKKEQPPQHILVLLWEEPEECSLFSELALSTDCSSIIQQRLSLDIVWKSPRDDLFNEMFLSRSLKSERFFLFFF